MLNLFKDYLIIGGMPDAVKTYLETKNLYAVREIHRDIFDLYMMDASKYDLEHKLKIERIYKMIPSIMGNIKKRIVVKNIEDKKGARYNHYVDEFDYLINSGIATEVKAISNPTFPLLQSTSKNLLKLYLNDVGLLLSLIHIFGESLEIREAGKTNEVVKVQIVKAFDGISKEDALKDVYKRQMY